MAPLRRFTAALWIGGGAFALWLASGVGFPNYDTLYSLVWGQQLARGQTPAYGVPIAPTPHPLAELLGVLLAPFGAAATETAVVALAYVSLASITYLSYRLGAAWFDRAIGLTAAAIVVTREPLLNFGVRAYVDLPFVALVLCAMLLEVRRPRRGWPVLALLALAGLLRPEAWLLSGAYWIWLALARPPQRRLAAFAALVVLGPLLWSLSDALISGDALWSLTHTRATAAALHRTTGLLNAPVSAVRNLGSVLWWNGALSAALGLAGWAALLRDRARLALAVAATALLAFAADATSGLPLDTRYVFLPATLLAIFAAVGLLGWRMLPSRDPRRRLWQLAAGAILLVSLALLPAQVHLLTRSRAKLRAIAQIQSDLASLTHHAISLRCGTIGVQYHQPIPLLALWLHTSPANIRAAAITQGEFVAAANEHVLKTYVLVKGDPGTVTRIPAGFARAAGNRSWTLYERCSSSH